MLTVILVSATCCLGIGFTVICVNPGRFTNQVYFLLSLFVTGWLLSVSEAIRVGELSTPQELLTRVSPWLRANAAIATLFPWTIWLLKESLVTDRGVRRTVISRSLPWLGFGTIMAALCYQESFLAPQIGSVYGSRGTAYIMYTLLGLGAYLYLIIQIIRQMRGQTGIRRVEMQFLALNFGAACIIGVALSSIGNLFHLFALKRLSPFVFAGSFALTAWAITFHRIFDARQVFLSLGQRLALALGLTLCIFGLSQFFGGFMPTSIGLFLSIAFCSSGAFWLDRQSRDWLGLTGERILAEIRAAVIEISRNEPHPDRLVATFEQLLRDRCQTPFASLLFDCGEVHASDKLELAKEKPGHTALCESGWATPESLQRRRSTPRLADLRQFIAQHSLGLIVTVPSGSQTPSLLVALGTKTNQWPYTYPEVQRLQNIAELMDNILIRARLSAHAALRARVEHLAMMSRGLAHDLNNLITPISSFLVHTEDRYTAGSAEQEVHAAAKRSIRTMTDYVREAMFFAKRLAPKFENIRLHDTFTAVHELTAPLAAHRDVIVSIAPAGDISLLADAVLIQRLLVNLVANAIDASAPGNTVALSIGESRAGWVRLQVTDQGCGIPPENLSRVFDPYFTTKEFGDETRGFGLGLTICQKIAELHEASISVRSEPGRGTTLTVDLPLSQALPPLQSPPRP